MIHCTLVLLARLAEIAGTAEVSMKMEAGATVADAVAQLRGRHPGLDDLLEASVPAIDDEYVPKDTPVKDGMTIALIPPVSGG